MTRTLSAPLTATLIFEAESTLAGNLRQIMDPLTELILKQPRPRPELKLWDILHRLGFLCENLEQALLNENTFTELPHLFLPVHD